MTAPPAGTSVPATPVHAPPPGSEPALSELLLTMADDEAVIGWTDSEWTGIAPLLEEDVAMSSLAQDELGHAAALYDLLAALSSTERDAIAYDRPNDAYRHARLLDHGRGDWAMTIARRFLYESADAVRLASLVGGSWAPLADLVGKMEREERYHRLHITAWFERLAGGDASGRGRLVDALERLAPDAATVFTPLPGEPALLSAGIASTSIEEQEAAWRAVIEPTFRRFGLVMPPAASDPRSGRTGHGDAFAWLHGEMTAVRAGDPGATW